MSQISVFGFRAFSCRKNRKTNKLFETTCYSHTTCTLFNLNGLPMIFVLMARLSKYYIEITRTKTCLIDFHTKKVLLYTRFFYFCTRTHGSPNYTSKTNFIIFWYKSNTLAWLLQKSKIFWKQLWSDVGISYILHYVSYNTQQDMHVFHLSRKFV